jgi:branched-chain amino acid aminotransferase
MANYTWLNGAFLDESTASISLRDTGLLHAAGVFTTTRSFNGHVFRLDRHLQRLRASCDALFIPLQYNDEQLTEALRELLERNDLLDARLRLTVTRGFATNDPLHGMRLDPTVFLTAAAVEAYPSEYYQRGMTAMVLDEQKLNPYDIQAGHKTLNYFSRLSALREATRRGAGETLWFNVHNYLQSGSVTNVFIVKDGALLTPPTQDELRDLQPPASYSRSNVLPGVTRGAVIDVARSLGIDVRASVIDINQLLEADEVFITNSIMLIMPVCRIERKAIGDDKPGPVTIRLSQGLREMIEQTL